MRGKKAKQNYNKEAPIQQPDNSSTNQISPKVGYQHVSWALWPN